MSELNAIEARVCEIVCQITGIAPDALSLDSDLRGEFNVDSLQGLEIVAAIENEWDIEVEEDGMDIYTTLRSIAQTVERLKG